MHLDFRFYVKFRNDDLWRDVLENTIFEALDGEEYSLLEISKVFSRLDFTKIMEPIGMIFDTVTAVEEEVFCFIHDRQKTFDFFTRLTNYLFEEIIEKAADDAVIIADITNFDDDSMGDHISYYLGGGLSGVKQCVIEGPDGLEHHEVEISNFAEMLKHESLSDDQKKMLADLTGNTYPGNLLSPPQELIKDLE